jgi:hypothetical protein
MGREVSGRGRRDAVRRGRVSRDPGQALASTAETVLAPKQVVGARVEQVSHVVEIERLLDAYQVGYDERYVWD